MGWFSKEEKVPTLPASPKGLSMPEKNPSMSNELPELPTLPNTPHTENLNQEMVKSAVSDSNLPGENEVHFDIPEGVDITEEHGGSMLPSLPPRGPEDVHENHHSLVPAKPNGLIPPNPTVPETSPAPVVVSPASPGKNLSPAMPKKTLAKKESNEPIFIRFDKFLSSQKNFKKIQDKIADVEKTLAKIADIKQKEDEELNKWASEVEGLKTRLSQIDDDVFNQI